MDQMAAVERRETAGDPTDAAIVRALGRAFGSLIANLGADTAEITNLEHLLERKTAAIAATGAPLREWEADQAIRAAAANRSECNDAGCARQPYVIAALEAALAALRAEPGQTSPPNET